MLWATTLPIFHRQSVDRVKARGNLVTGDRPQIGAVISEGQKDPGDQQNHRAKNGFYDIASH
jgi:hypothetical protein